MECTLALDSLNSVFSWQYTNFQCILPVCIYHATLPTQHTIRKLEITDPSSLYILTKALARNVSLKSFCQNSLQVKAVCHNPKNSIFSETTESEEKNECIISRCAIFTVYTIFTDIKIKIEVKVKVVLNSPPNPGFGGSNDILPPLRSKVRALVSNI